MTDIDRRRAIDAADVLNDFIGEFATGVMVFRAYSAQFYAGRLSDEGMVGIQKMCVSQVVLTLAKFEEFWKRYRDVVPIEHHEACNGILKAIGTRKINKFRNQVVGHIWNRDEQRPLRLSEIMRALNSIVGPNFDSFLDWVHNPKANTYPSSIVSIIYVVRDAVMAVHSIRPEEIVSR